MLRLALITLAAVVAAAASAQEKPRKRLDQGEGIEAGKPAADFKLKKLKVRRDEKDGAVQLSSFRGKAPVLLIFGSYT